MHAYLAILEFKKISSNNSFLPVPYWAFVVIL